MGKRSEGRGGEKRSPMPTSVYQLVDPPPTAERTTSRCPRCLSIRYVCTCHLEDAAHNVRMAAESAAPVVMRNELEPAFVTPPSHVAANMSSSERLVGNSPSRVRRPQVCTVDGKWIDEPTAGEEAEGRIVWGAGTIGGRLRQQAADNALLIHFMDNMAKILGVPVVTTLRTVNSQGCTCAKRSMP